ncbi:MAG: hypothetical protein EAZ57_06975 [Cytophagales bacterium]|nr:MAG: hypothetical protein EAZ67_07560 [Cytophagales bacterium]TAF60597.1 MAG: hypothetical protein EAZ57_06975 [Cytophagales bacterium]
MWQLVKTWDWKAILVCLLTSIAVWMLNALNEPNYTTTINYPITIKTSSNDSIVALEAPPDYLPVNVSGSGWQLLRYSFYANLKPITAHLQNPLESRPLPTQPYLQILSDMLKESRLKVLGLRQDSIRFKYDKLETRLIKIIFDSSRLNTANGYLKVSPVKVEPQWIKVTAPRTAWAGVGQTLMLISQNPNESLRSKYTEFIDIPALTKSSLERRNVAQIAVEFDVAACESKEMKLPIKLNGFIPKNLKTNVEAVKMRFFVRRGYAADEIMQKMYYELTLSDKSPLPEQLPTHIKHVKNLFKGCLYPQLITDTIRIQYDRKKKNSRHNGRYW